MKPTDKFRTVSGYGELSPEDIELIDRTLPPSPDVNDEENRDIQDIIPEFDTKVTIFDNRVTWVWSAFPDPHILFGFEGARGYLLVYDVGTKQTLKKTWFGPMVKTESRLLVAHLVDDLTDRTLTGGRQAVSIGGWVMDRPGPEHAHMEFGKDYKIDKPISFIDPSGDHSIVFDWILGDRIEATIHPEPGRFGYAIPRRTGRWAFQGSFWFMRKQLKLKRLFVKQTAARRFWTTLFHIPFWLFRMDGMTTNYKGHPKLLTKDQIRRHDALAEKYGWD